MTKQVIRSPQGKLELVVEHHSSPGRMVYQLKHHQHQIIEPSRLGLVVAGENLTQGLSLNRVSPLQSVEDRFQLPHGKERVGQITGVEQRWGLRSANGWPLEIIFRVFDQGIGFRYRIAPDPNSKSPPSSNAAHPKNRFQVTEELTEFVVAASEVVWRQEAPRQTRHHSPAYEEYYLPQHLSSPPPLWPQYWNLPVLFMLSNRWMLLTETDLTGTYAGAHLVSIPSPNRTNQSFRVCFPFAHEGNGVGTVEPVISLPWASPWRVLVVGDSPGKIAESNLVTHLASPASPGDWSWVKPGRAAWSWWSDHSSSRDLTTQYRYLDFVAKEGWEYLLVDANWVTHDPSQIERLSQTAQQQGVGLWLWYNSGGSHNQVTEQPRDRMDRARFRRREMELISSWGVKGIKVDFFHSDKQTGIQLMEAILEDAARFRLLVNFHGCTIPRGWTRRWPHLLTVEAVRGAEQYGFASEYPDRAAAHHTTLVFTRNAVGPMDYTPVTFSDQKYPRLTTAAHELALSVLFESGIQHWADSIDSYRRQPPAVRKWLATVPVVWDELRVLAGFPGEYVLLARRWESHWYVAAVNGGSACRSVQFDPAELDAVGYSGLLISNGEQQGSLAIEWRENLSPDPWKITLATHGGWVARLTPPG